MEEKGRKEEGRNGRRKGGREGGRRERLRTKEGRGKERRSQNGRDEDKKGKKAGKENTFEKMIKKREKMERLLIMSPALVKCEFNYVYLLQGLAHAAMLEKARGSSTR